MKSRHTIIDHKNNTFKDIVAQIISGICLRAYDLGYPKALDEKGVFGLFEKGKTYMFELDSSDEKIDEAIEKSGLPIKDKKFSAAMAAGVCSLAPGTSKITFNSPEDNKKNSNALFTYVTFLHYKLDKMVIFLNALAYRDGSVYPDHEIVMITSDEIPSNLLSLKEKLKENED